MCLLVNQGDCESEREERDIHRFKVPCHVVETSHSSITAPLAVLLTHREGEKTGGTEDYPGPCACRQGVKYPSLLCFLLWNLCLPCPPPPRCISLLPLPVSFTPRCETPRWVLLCRGLMTSHCENTPGLKIAVQHQVVTDTRFIGTDRVTHSRFIGTAR